MGKSLIIKGADFHANAVNPVKVLDLYQGFVTSNPKAGSYGKLSLGTDNTMKNRYITAKIPIGAGESIKVFLSDNNEVISRIDSTGIFSTLDIPMVDANIVTNIVSGFYPQSTDMVQSDGSYLYTNNSDAYLYLYVSWGVSSGSYSVEGKTAKYRVV